MIDGTQRRSPWGAAAVGLAVAQPKQQREHATIGAVLRTCVELCVETAAQLVAAKRRRLLPVLKGPSGNATGVAISRSSRNERGHHRRPRPASARLVDTFLFSCNADLSRHRVAYDGAMDDDAFAKHQRRLLHNAPKASPRQPKTGEESGD